MKDLTDVSSSNNASPTKTNSNTSSNQSRQTEYEWNESAIDDTGCACSKQANSLNGQTCGVGSLRPERTSQCGACTKNQHPAPNKHESRWKLLFQRVRSFGTYQLDDSRDQSKTQKIDLKRVSASIQWICV